MVSLEVPLEAATNQAQLHDYQVRCLHEYKINSQADWQMPPCVHLGWGVHPAVQTWLAACNPVADAVIRFVRCEALHLCL